MTFRSSAEAVQGGSIKAKGVLTTMRVGRILFV
jgi:hypothetical protein